MTLTKVVLVKRKVLGQGCGMSGNTMIAFLTRRQQDSVGMDMAHLKAVHKCFPVEVCPGHRTIPGVIILPAVRRKQGKLISDFFSGTRRRSWVEIIAKLFLEADRRRFSGVKIDKYEPLSGDMGVDLEERMLLGIEIRQIAVLPGFVQLARRQIRPVRDLGKSITKSITKTQHAPSMKLAGQHCTRATLFLRHGMTSMPANVVKRVYVTRLVPDEEEVPAKHLARLEFTCGLVMGMPTHLQSQVISGVAEASHKTCNVPELAVIRQSVRPAPPLCLIKGFTGREEPGLHLRWKRGSASRVGISSRLGTIWAMIL